MRQWLQSSDRTLALRGHDRIDVLLAVMNVFYADFNDPSTGRLHS
jgi:hypothetical protein